MKKAALLLIGVGLAFEVLFLLTGAGEAKPPPSDLGLASWAGSPWLALVGGLTFLGGVLCLGVRLEALLVFSLGTGLGFSGAVGVGVARSWDHSVLATLALGGGSQVLIALFLSLFLAGRLDVSRSISLPCAGLAFLLCLCYLVVFVLGGQP